ERCHAARIELHQPKTLTPLSFPLWAEGMRGTLSSEDWRTRVQRVAERLEQRHAEALDLAIAGEPVRMLADRALYWPARARLLVADLHLGKGDTFRAAGIAVPSGGTAHDLARLAILVERSRARELWILGDFLHARRTAAVDAAWRGFRDAHAAVAMAVVPGNHDHAFDPEAAGVERLPDGIVDGP